MQAQNIKKRLSVLTLALFTSLLLMALQPNVNPKVGAVLQPAGLRRGYEFLPLWQGLCLPYSMIDAAILVVGLLLFGIIGGQVLFSRMSTPRKTITFALVYSSLHLAWYVAYADPFVPLHGGASAIMIAVVLYYFEDMEVCLSRKPRELAIPYIQERIATLRQILTYSHVVAVAIATSVFAFNYQFMEKKFGAAGEGDHGTALSLAQGSQTTMLVWNAVLFLCIYVPVIHGRIYSLNKAILDLKADSPNGVWGQGIRSRFRCIDRTWRGTNPKA